MADTIQKLTIEGFKSIRKLEDFPLRGLNILIGANGAGKSNFVSFFRLLREMIEERLQVAVAKEGGADACLFMGPKITKRFAARLYWGDNYYEFSLAPTPDNQFFFESEADGGPEWSFSGFAGHRESQLREFDDARAAKVSLAISGWVIHHFDDTTAAAGVRRAHAINDNEYLRPDAENLAPFLYLIQQTDPSSYSRIRDVVRLAAPFFDDFKLRPMPATPNMIQLEWRQQGSDYPFRALQLSDGTLRFLCLAVALLQPRRPATMIFDEPELGLHPYALTLLANLFKQAADNGTQLIVSTQSATLLNEFAPEDVVVVERSNGESTFRRLDSARLSEWLEDYALGELWQKNVLGGLPRDERFRELVP